MRKASKKKELLGNLNDLFRFSIHVQDGCITQEDREYAIYGLTEEEVRKIAVLLKRE